MAGHKRLLILLAAALLVASCSRSSRSPGSAISIQPAPGGKIDWPHTTHCFVHKRFPPFASLLWSPAIGTDPRTECDEIGLSDQTKIPLEGTPGKYLLQSVDVKLVAHLGEDEWKIEPPAAGSPPPEACAGVPEDRACGGLGALEIAGLVEMPDGQRVWAVWSYDNQGEEFYRALSATRQVSLLDILPARFLGHGPPDLVPELSLPAPGQLTCNLTITIRNRGSGAAVFGPGPTTLFESVQQKSDVTSTLWPELDPLLPPRSSIEAGIVVDVGSYLGLVSVTVDPGGTLAESDEGNNSASIDDRRGCVVATPPGG